jgi:MYXO-CTERM domain-containing protein
VASLYGSFLSQPNNELWMYQSCDVHGCGAGNNSSPGAVGWPSIMVDATGTRNRAMEWLTFQAGATGELYYETTQAYTDPGDPWQTVYVPSFSGNGDGTLYFPGTPAQVGGSTHIPIASYRLKMIREGMEDYEYLKKASDLGGAALAMQVSKGLFTAANKTDVSVSDLMAARAQLAAYIVANTNPTPCSDGTLAGQCSAEKPAQCVGGKLVDACQGCGCPAGARCQADGTCRSTTYDAYPMAPPPVIGGAIAEYGALVALPIGSGDGSAVVRAGWDAEALYLAFDVKDDQLVAAPAGEENTWDGDGVELMLDPKLDRSATADADDVHLVIGVSGQVSDSRGWTDFGWSSGATVAVDTQGAVVPGPAVNGGYRVQVALPWAAIGVTPAAGLTLGFDVAVNDKDASAGPVVSHDFMGLAAFNDPAGWGTLVLAAGPADAGAPSTSTGSGGGPSGGGSPGVTGGCAVAATDGSGEEGVGAWLLGLAIAATARRGRRRTRS